ncbi:MULTISPECIES: ABC transporter substrate-binding protein [unclassified Clostridioides]|uniref:ABC transporter substrate-binding protein n=1 Tax=unclassified Clostridioides TaxID=2635829 RepID=UPI001D0C41EC|nr:ABC transporter substrate-binding protein [Clostridioides sp. ES-S-0048-02]MCC0764171.1 ABC transporter substrate-binding protein [Clostridioides sp. ES-S-0006-03]
MKLKRKLATGLAITLLLGSLVGCSNSNTSKGEKTDSNITKIDFWAPLGGTNGETAQKMVDQFNSEHKDIQVNMLKQKDYYENATKLQAALTSKDQPDVTLLEITQTGTFASAGALVDMSKYFDKAYQERFFSGLLTNSYYENKFVGMPFNRSTPILYINKDMAVKAGLDPSGPKSWEELKTYASKMTNKSEDTYGFETPIDIWFYEAMVMQSGGEITDGKKVAFNNEAGQAPVKFWQDMMKSGIMKMPPGEDYNAWDVAKQDFVNGKVGMIFTSTADLAGLMQQTDGKFEISTAFLPKNQKYATPTGGANLVMLEGGTDKEKDASAEFMEWMTQTDKIVQFSSSTGYLPTTEDATKSEKLQTLYKEKPQYKVATDQLQYAVALPMLNGYKEATDKLMDEIKKGLTDLNVAPKDAVSKGTSAMQAVIDKTNK